MIDRYSKFYQNRTPSRERAQYKDENENKENNDRLKNKLNNQYDQSLGLRDPV
jgi:hypothetical protein